MTKIVLLKITRMLKFKTKAVIFYERSKLNENRDLERQADRV